MVFDIILTKILDSFIDFLKGNRNKILCIGKNIHIYITDSHSENPLTVDLKKTTKISYASWYAKVNSGGDIYVHLEDVRIIKKYIKKNKDIEEKDYKAFIDFITHREHKEELIKTLVTMGLKEENISKNIKNFSQFVNIIVEKCLDHLKLGHHIEDKKTVLLAVYNEKKPGFKFRISEEEYLDVCKRSEDRIRVPRFYSFNEFMNDVTDKSILEKEVLPMYLISIVMEERNLNKKITVEDLFGQWWISLD